MICAVWQQLEFGNMGPDLEINTGIDCDISGFTCRNTSGIGHGLLRKFTSVMRLKRILAPVACILLVHCAGAVCADDEYLISGESAGFAPKIGPRVADSDRFHVLTVSYSILNHGNLVLFRPVANRGCGSLYFLCQTVNDRVVTLQDLAGRVSIKSENEALCYARTFTTPDTCGAGMFPDSVQWKNMHTVELATAKKPEDREPGHVSTAVSKRLGLAAARIRWTGKDWEVRRYVYVMHTGPAIAIVEHVGPKGEYSWRTEKGGGLATPEEVNAPWQVRQ